MAPSKVAKGTAKRKSTAPSVSQKVQKPRASRAIVTKTTKPNTSKKLPRTRSPSVSSDDSEQGDEVDPDPGNHEFNLSNGRTRDVPMEVIQDRYCLFCWDQQGIKVHHSIPSAAEVRELEKNLQSLQRELHNTISESSSDSEQDNNYSHRVKQRRADGLNGLKDVSRTQNITDVQGKSERYTVQLWQFERAQELYKKGFGASFDLWIDHLTLTQILRDNWTYESVRQKLPEDWIEEPDFPEFLKDKRLHFPREADQPGDIDKEAGGPSDEELVDDIDDHDQRAVVDSYRMQNVDSMLALGLEDHFAEIGDNLSHEAARTALNNLRNNEIPELVKKWRDIAKPFIHRDSKLEMKDYTKDVYEFKQPGSESAPSLQAYRAVTNIAFSMQAAQHLWKRAGITDEGYTKLLRDGFDQLADLREDMEKDGVTGLPPLLDLPPPLKSHQKKFLKPFIIDHSMDARESQVKGLYAYKPDRPLGPMLSENSHGVKGKKQADKATKRTKRTKQTAISRQELVGLNMELDQLVDAGEV